MKSNYWLSLWICLNEFIIGKKEQHPPVGNSYLGKRPLAERLLYFKWQTDYRLSGMQVFGSALIGIANGVGVPYLNTIASIKGGKNSATTVMPLLSAALYLGQFVSLIIVTPTSHILFGSADLTGPYKVGIMLCLLFMAQVYFTRHFQSLPPKWKT